MRLFVYSRDVSFEQRLSEASPVFSEVVTTSGSYSSSVTVTEFVSSFCAASLAVLDFRVPDTEVCWLAGLALGVGIPFLVLANVDDSAESRFPFLSLCVSVFDDLDSIISATSSMGLAIKDGLISGAEMSAELHADFVRRRLRA